MSYINVIAIAAGLAVVVVCVLAFRRAARLAEYWRKQQGSFYPDPVMKRVYTEANVRLGSAAGAVFGFVTVLMGLTGQFGRSS